MVPKSGNENCTQPDVKFNFGFQLNIFVQVSVVKGGGMTGSLTDMLLTLKVGN